LRSNQTPHEDLAQKFLGDSDMTKLKTLLFENRAWEEAEHPGYVSDTLKISEN